jgi:putative spermidine/putrescine transport system permease protein
MTLTDTLTPPSSAAVATARRPRKTVPGKGRVRWVLFALVLAYLLVPPLSALFYSLSATHYDGLLPTDWTLEHWGKIVTDDRLQAAIWRSLTLALGTVFFVMLLVLPPLYWAYVRTPALRTVMLGLALVPFSLPFVVMAFGIERVAEKLPIISDYSGTGWMVLLGHVTLCFAFFLWPVDSAMAGADIKLLHEAAQTSGAGPITTLVRCVIPNIIPGIVSGAVLVFAISWGEYAIAKIMTRSQYEIVPIWQVNLTPVNGTSDPRGVAVMAVFTFVLFLTVSLVAALGGAGRRRTQAADLTPTDES